MENFKFRLTFYETGVIMENNELFKTSIFYRFLITVMSCLGLSYIFKKFLIYNVESDSHSFFTALTLVFTVIFFIITLITGVSFIIYTILFILSKIL
jgi:hypothetical protein